MRKKGKESKKPYRSSLSNALWSFRNILRIAPIAFLLMVLEVPVNVFLAWSDIYLPSLAVAEVTSNATLLHAAGSVGLLLGLMILSHAIKWPCHLLPYALLEKYAWNESLHVDRKYMNLFYQTFERKETRDLYDRALRATQMWNGVRPITDAPWHTIKLIENVVCYLLFGAIISFVSPWLLPILTAAPLVNWLCARAYRQWEHNQRAEWSDLDRKLRYVRKRSGDFAAAKDIRLYSLGGWFREVWQDLFRQRGVCDRKKYFRSFLSRLADLLIIFLRDGAAYAVLISMTLAGEISIDQFVLYFAAISSFATYVGNIMNEWNGIQAVSLKLCDLREFMDLPDQEDAGRADIAPCLSSAPEITFDHVSFRYEGAEKDTLSNISFTMHPGEKIALVGLNGAGKSTLVKLMCRLYLPTSGEIRVNGIPAGDFPLKDYYRLFSAVFQDAQTGYFSLAETVSGQIMSECDRQRAERCLRMADLGEKLDSLPMGLDTKLDKQAHADGIELSGGEVQKLMLARALYKDAPVLVLDEPTAALDPIAENKIYLKYHEMTVGKTSLFISHRLASTQFCDRILYLKDGSIQEMGTHDELMALGGEYSELYEMQSCWYREDYEGGKQE